MSEVQIGFEEIKQGDEIRVVRYSDAVTITIEGVAEFQDEDGDWESGIELLTYKDSHYVEEYFLIKSGSLPTKPGTLLTYPNYLGLPVYALKAYGDDGWLTAFPDGSSALIGDLYISRKEWRLV